MWHETKAQNLSRTTAIAVGGGDRVDWKVSIMGVARVIYWRIKK